MRTNTRFNSLNNVYVSYGTGVAFRKPMLMSLADIYNEIVHPTPEIVEKIEKIRQFSKLGEKAKVKQLKKELPAFTCSGNFEDRNNEGLIEHSGRLQIDLDNLDPAEIQEIKSKLSRDNIVEFVCLSPSGTGLKAVIRIPKAVKNSKHKKSFFAAQHYFRENYGLEIDHSCQDVSRLCFVSYDPDAYINEDATVLDVDCWYQEQKPVSIKPPPRLDPPTKSTPTGQDHPYAQKVLDSACEKISAAPDGQRHQTRRDEARLVGGYVGGGHLEEGSARSRLLDAALRNTDNAIDAERTIHESLENGKAAPLDPPQNQNAQPHGEDPSPHNSDQNGMECSALYRFSESGTFRMMRNKSGDLVPDLIANFTARILEELMYDDGERAELKYRIKGERGDESYPEVIVPAEEFNSLKFVEMNWGCTAQIFPGHGVRDKLRHAIQVNSEEVTRTTIYTHTGIREINGKLTYLSSSGALDCEGVQVVLDDSENEKLNRYALPTTSSAEEVHSGTQASLSFLEVADYSVSIPLLVLTYAPVISSLIQKNFASLYLLGPSGCHKSTLAALALCHYGDFTADNLHTFNDTVNSLERASYILKDAPMLVDDFYPTTNQYDQKRMISTFEGVTRSAGNRSGRGRMRSDLKLRRTFYPRGVVWFTGEDLIGAGSALARLILVEMEPNSVDIEILSEIQTKRHLLPHALADFLRWLFMNVELVRTIFANQTGEYDELYQQGKALHRRLIEQIILSVKMVRVLCIWLTDRGVLNGIEADSLYERAYTVFVQNAQRLQERIQTSNPTEQFIEIMQALNSSGKIWVKPFELTEAEKPLNKEFFGWRKDGYIFAQSRVVWQLVQNYCQRERSTFPVGERTLWEHLARTGVLIRQADQVSGSMKIPAENNRSIRVMKFKEDQLFG